MVTWLEQDRILFTCDFFGSHLATSDLYAEDEARVYESAKRYYAEIMMPFRSIIQKNMEKIKDLQIEIIAPSHGPLYRRPVFIMGAYKDWISDNPKNVAVVPYVSMHGSTKSMAEHLVAALTEKGVTVHQFDLAATDIGKLAITLVDAATIVIGTPTVHVGPHPAAFFATHLASVLRPRLKFASVIGSYGWASKAVEQISGLVSNLKLEILNPVLCKGYPRKRDFDAIDRLAETIVQKHQNLA
jgi:flavorubredoxin